MKIFLILILISIGCLFIYDNMMIIWYDSAVGYVDDEGGYIGLGWFIILIIVQLIKVK